MNSTEYWLLRRKQWLPPTMTEKLLAWTLSLNTNKHLTLILDSAHSHITAETEKGQGLAPGTLHQRNFLAFQPGRIGFWKDTIFKTKFCAKLKSLVFFAI